MLLANFAKGRDGIGGGGGGGGGSRHGLGGDFLPILVVSGMARLVVGAGIDALTKTTSGTASLFTLDLSNLSAMSFCMSLNFGLWCSPIGSFFIQDKKRRSDSFPRNQFMINKVFMHK